MGKTVAEEMSAKERGERLLKGLNATGDEEVIVTAAHLIQVVGMAKAEELTINLTEARLITESKFSRTPRLTRLGHAQVNREDTIKAVEEALKGLPEELACFDMKTTKSSGPKPVPAKAPESN